MKQTLQHLLTVCLSLILIQNSYAANFKAIKSGDWSSSATWGGTAPVFNNLLDEIEISSGVVVNLDQNAKIDGLLATLIVDGTLMTDNASTLTISKGKLSGEGMISVDQMILMKDADSDFKGNLNTRTLVVSDLDFGVWGMVDVEDTLSSLNNKIELYANGSINLAADAYVRLNDAIIEGSGSLKTTTKFTIAYTGSAIVTGKEMMADNINNVMIEMDNATSTVKLASDGKINGTLMLTKGILDMNRSSLTIAGDFEQNSSAKLRGNSQSNLVINTASGLSNTIQFENATNSLNSLIVDIEDKGTTKVEGDVTISSDIHVENGNLEIQDKSKLMLSDTGSILIGDGAIVLKGTGMYENKGMFDIMYKGETKNSGVELESGTLNDFTLALDGENQDLMLMTSVMVSGQADFKSGAVVMNNNNIVVNGSITENSELAIDGDKDAGLWINAQIGDMTSVWFKDSDTIGVLALDFKNSNDINVYGNVIIEDTLRLTNGNMLLMNSNIDLSTNSMLEGGSSNSYMVTLGTSTLGLEVEGQGTVYTEFPIGDDEGYSPVRLKNSSMTDGMFHVNLAEGVFSEGTTGEDLSLTGDFVNRTWNIDADSNVDVDLTIEAEWTSEMETNSFDRSKVYLSHYTNGDWDVDTDVQAKTTTSGSFYVTREGITSLSPFSVQNPQNSFVKEPLAKTLNCYPNPAVSALTIDNLNNMYETILVTDMSGKELVFINDINSSKVDIDVSTLESGVYYITCMSGKEAKSSIKFLKY